MKSAIVLLLATSVFATDCRNRNNFPATLSIGKTYPITPVADSGDRVKVSGAIKILSPCSFQFVDFSLSNAKASRDIQVYGVASNGRGFPVSPDVLSGPYSHAVGPTIELFDNSEFLVDDKIGGVSFSDFAFIRIYSKQTKTVLAVIKLPELGRFASPKHDASIDSASSDKKASNEASEKSVPIVVSEVPLLDVNQATNTVKAPADKVVASPTSTATGTETGVPGSAQVYGKSVVALLSAVAVFMLL